MKNIVVFLICFLIHINTALSYIRPPHISSMSSMRHGPTFVEYFMNTALSYIRPPHISSMSSMSSMRHGPTFVEYFMMWTFLGIISLILLFILFAFCTPFLPDRVSRVICFIFVGIYYLLYYCIKIIIKPFQLLYAILWSKK